MTPSYLYDPRSTLEAIMHDHPQLCLNGLDGPWTEEISYVLLAVFPRSRNIRFVIYDCNVPMYVFC